MLKRLSRPFSQWRKWRKIIDRLLIDEAGTAAVLSPQRSSAPPIPGHQRRLFLPPRIVDEQFHVAETVFPKSPVIRAEGNCSAEYQAVKRALDIVGSLVLLILLSPILLTMLVVLAITTRGKPLFAQERVGHCGRRFKMYKFRTMRLDADKLQHLVQNEKDGPIFKNRCDPRVTRLGRWLRKTSIDEMPQLVSVLIGDMSLVGPRPPVPKEVAQYKPWQRRRLSVKPGLTCLWQVSGRSNIGFEDWVRMDIWYLSHQNLLTDLKLLVRTPLKVITCKGAY
jgi:lipopolysaccharide/colanic/teichoic acid biosynthesis glycosyltransferase